ncbi:MAG: hypothetical protein D6797_04125 [Bdellovibrio sp.]|nr:MAG: hypothetical protein D6797_04125 [Bdellovibrio sp.]
MKYLTLFLMIFIFLHSNNTLARPPFKKNKKSPLLSQSFLGKTASTGPFSAQKAKVILDNDVAFQTKIKAIQSAQKSIEMIYYIYADDYTSSFFSRELLKAAKERQVHVRILLDYLTNFHNMDYFLSMETAGGKDEKGIPYIQFRFYNKPTRLIIKDAIYLTLPCLKNQETCPEDKKDLTQEVLKQSPYGSFLSQLLLSGIYAKKASAIKTAIVMGQQINLEKSKDNYDFSKEDLKGLKDFVRLLWKSKVQKSLLARVQLWLAFQLYGEKLKPLYQAIRNSLPIEVQNPGHVKDWQFISDYTHHKLLIVDNRIVQLGGRNIEDSYHLKVNDLNTSKKKKYIFMDTDMWVQVAPKDGQKIRTTFERLWNFKKMVADSQEALKLTPFVPLKNLALVQKSLQMCQNEKTKPLVFQNCTQEIFQNLVAQSGISLKKMLLQRQKEISQKAEDYERNHLQDKEARITWNLSSPSYQDHFRRSDLLSANFYYLENLPFKKGSLQRQYGASLLNAQNSNKNIHALWVEALKNTCYQSSQKHPQTIILHNAYVFFPPVILQAFGKMMDGSWPCKHVKVLILTNSYSTTDLFPVNALASTQLKALFQMNQQSSSKGAQFSYFEYKKESEEDSRSLHTKVSLFGNDVFIGSANMDIRSYMSDTNNGFFVQNTKDFASQYRKFIQSIIEGKHSDYKVVNLTTALKDPQVSLKEFIHQQINIIEHVLKRFKFAQKHLFAPDKKQQLEKFRSLVSEILDFIYVSSKYSLSLKNIKKPSSTTSSCKPNCALRQLQKLKRKRQKLQKKLNLFFHTI